MTSTGISFDSTGPAGPCQCDRSAAALEQAKRLERRAAIDEGLRDLEGWRLLVDASRRVGTRQDGETIDVGEPEVIVRDPVHDAIHRRRGPYSEADGKACDGNEARARRHIRIA